MDKQVQNKIEALGFDKKFHAIESDKLSEFVIARVTSVHKNRFTISNGQNEVFAEMSGKLFSNINSVFDYPVVGDWVLVHAGFALNTLDEEEARETWKYLEEAGLAQAPDEFGES